MDYNQLVRELKSTDGKIYSIGKSLLGREIFCIERGSGGASVIIHGAIHAREHLTADVVMYLAHSAVPDGVKHFFIPMVNPDGVEIALHQTIGLPDKYKLLVDSVTDDFFKYKANARCVDLNVNFDAKWGQGASNVRRPSTAGYIGEHPFSEPESVALRDFTVRVKPRLTISYHLAGEEIYWGFENKFPYREQTERFARSTGYVLKSSAGSTGGYKDWYVKNFDGIGMTFEVGRNLGYPYPDTELDLITEKNKNVLNVIADVLSELKWI